MPCLVGSAGIWEVTTPPLPGVLSTRQIHHQDVGVLAAQVLRKTQPIAQTGTQVVTSDVNASQFVKVGTRYRTY
jgi:hypothetical protein